ncbi:MAG: CoA-binding protein [Azospirillaceae bacterium]
MPDSQAAAPHDSYDDAHLKAVLDGVRTIALVGASPKSVRPSYFVMKYLQTKGFRVIPVNPGVAGGTILGETVHASLADIPEPVDMVDVFRAPDAAPGIVEEALAMEPRPKVIWMQLGVRHDGAAAAAEAAGLTVVMDRCPKQEWARLHGEFTWHGFNSGIISSRKRPLRPMGG